MNKMLIQNVNYDYEISQRSSIYQQQYADQQKDLQLLVKAHHKIRWLQQQLHKCQQKITELQYQNNELKNTPLNYKELVQQNKRNLEIIHVLRKQLLEKRLEDISEFNCQRNDRSLNEKDSKVAERHKGESINQQQQQLNKQQIILKEFNFCNHQSKLEQQNSQLYQTHNQMFTNTNDFLQSCKKQFDFQMQKIGKFNRKSVQANFNNIMQNKEQKIAYQNQFSKTNNDFLRQAQRNFEQQNEKSQTQIKRTSMSKSKSFAQLNNRSKIKMSDNKIQKSNQLARLKPFQQKTNTYSQLSTNLIKKNRISLIECNKNQNKSKITRNKIMSIHL